MHLLRYGRWLRWIGPAAAASLVIAACGQSSSAAPKVTGPIAITYATNGVLGGKNDQGAEWIHNWAVPTFERQEAKAGIHVTVNVEYIGGSGDSYAKQMALDAQSKTSPDVYDLDGPYVGEFATSGYIKPLDQVVGANVVNSWSGWSEMSKTVLANMSFDGKLYGLPMGTDGRVLFYNKNLFQQAGLPTNWHPRSWNDIINAAKQIKEREPGVIPLQFDAGANANFGEATTLQGFLPFLAGAGQLIYNEQTHKWQGDTPAMREALGFFQTIYSEGLADRSIQVNPEGRTVSFQEFAQGKIAVYLESEYLYESVLAPDGLAPMADRATAVGWTLIPAMAPGKGIRGQDYVSLSGGGGRVLSPFMDHRTAQVAWDFLTFLNSKQAYEKFFTYEPIISPRKDANATLTDPLLHYIATNVLKYTAYRPSLAVYPQVSADIQTMTQSVAMGQQTPAQAAQTFASEIESIPGIGPSNVTNS